MKEYHQRIIFSIVWGFVCFCGIIFGLLNFKESPYLLISVVAGFVGLGEIPIILQPPFGYSWSDIK